MATPPHFTSILVRVKGFDKRVILLANNDEVNKILNVQIDFDEFLSSISNVLNEYFLEFIEAFNQAEEPDPLKKYLGHDGTEMYSLYDLLIHEIIDFYVVLTQQIFSARFKKSKALYISRGVLFHQLSESLLDSIFIYRLVILQRLMCFKKYVVQDKSASAHTFFFSNIDVWSEIFANINNCQSLFVINLTHLKTTHIFHSVFSNGKCKCIENKGILVQTEKKQRLEKKQPRNDSTNMILITCFLVVAGVVLSGICPTF